MEDLDKAKKRRSLFRRNVTKLANRVKELLEGSEPIEDGALQHLKTELQEKQLELKKSNGAILDLLLEHVKEEQVLDNEIDEVSIYKEKISSAIFSIDRHLRANEELSTRLRKSVSQDSLNSNMSELSTGSRSSRKINVKLPKLELKKFSGKIHEWPEFWDGFQSVHQNPDLADCDKFKYLKSFLEEPARKVVAGMPMTDDNYATAVEHLQKRFGKQEMIEQAHINNLMRLQPVFNERAVSRLRNLHDEIETHHRGLEALGVNTFSYSSIVVPAVLQKIPESIRGQMIRSSDKSYLKWSMEELLHLLEKEISIKECQMPLGNPNGKDNNSRPNNSNNNKKEGTASTLLVGGKVHTCVFCMKDHTSETCTNVTGTENRKNILRKYAKCFVCLKSGHRAFSCRSRVDWRLCNGRHHVSICDKDDKDANADKVKPSAPAQPIPSTAPPTPTLNPTASSWVGSTGSGGDVALQTASANVNGERVRILYDSGNHKSFVTAEAVNKLGLSVRREERLGIKPFGSVSAKFEVKDVVSVPIVSCDGKKRIDIECFVVDNISHIKNVHPEVVKKSFNYLHEIWFSDFSRLESLKIDVLVGSDWLWSFMDGEIKRGGPGEPVAVKTAMGWVLSGPLQGTSSNSNEVSVNFVPETSSLLLKADKMALEEKVQKLWDLDTLGIREENEVHENLLDNITFTGERYSVGLPWKAGNKTLPTNFDNALARLNSLFKKLKKDPSTLKRYDDIIKEQVRLGIVEQVSELEMAEKTHYLPHMAVVREEAETTKVRIVYDASCKDKKYGTSLNDCLHVGPPLSPLIFDILLRFRENKIALVGDIEKAFLNIEIDPADRDCLRFLWVDDINKDEPKVCVMKFRRAVFGVCSSPFQLNAVLRHHIGKYQDLDPEFVTKLTEGFYVDDLVTGAKSVEEVRSLYLHAKERMQSGGFRLRKWKSSDQALDNEIKSEERKLERAAEDATYAKESLGGTVEGKKTKVLGVIWDNVSDRLELDFAKMCQNASREHPTKRGILSVLASLFDPHGILSPVGVTAKILFQDLCKLKVGWDDPIPESFVETWKSWIDDLERVNSISLPRCFYGENESEVKNVEIHAFGDASRKAYCAVVYLVYETSEGIQTKLLCSKSRVAPLKEMTIPRLELLSARILATLVDTVKKALSSQLEIKTVKLWLDSKTALSWIHGQGEWKQWVQFRVSEILKVTNVDDWGHVKGLENPADIGSRGANISQLMKGKLWWEGPQWLSEGRENWPKQEVSLESSEEVECERKKVNVLAAAVEYPQGISSVIDINKYSTLKRLLRVTAFVLRFVQNLKAKREGKLLNVAMLNAQEIQKAECEWIKDAQMSAKNSRSFDKVRVQLGIEEENGVLVCKGRLENADLSLESKHPVFLPKEHRLTELIVRDCHERVFHSLVRATLAELRARFWVTKARQFVKKILHSCLLCRKLEGKPYCPPPTGQLPEYRVKKSDPFANVGIDFAGPLYVKVKKGAMKKVYICLFSCCVTRALHLELVQDLSVPTFLNCLRRFCARRGTPDLINSDNAKTFKSTARFLKKLQVDRNFQAFLEAKRIKWKFNLELSPWQGGHFERMVRSVKRCLRKVLGNAKVSYDELNTILSEVECILNNRPLTYLYDELGGEVLTPSHFITGRRLTMLSTGIEYRSQFDEEDNQSSLCKRFLHLTRLLNHFWSRWKKEYLLDLRESHRMNKNTPADIKTGDIVVVQDDNLKRGQWKIAVVKEVIKGKDGHIRGAKVCKAGRGKYEPLNRPIQKLYPLVSVNGDLREEKKENLTVEENERSTGARPIRAAARDARLKTQILLDDA